MSATRQNRQVPATLVNGEFEYKLVLSYDPDAIPLFESEDADEVMAYAVEHGYRVHALAA